MTLSSACSSIAMSWQRLSRPAATFSCSTMALFTKPKRSCWTIILSPSSSRLTHPNSILLSGSGLTSKINWRVTCLPPWRNFLSRWLKLSVGIQPLTYARLQRSLTSSRLLSQLMYTNHKETVLQPHRPVTPFYTSQETRCDSVFAMHSGTLCVPFLHPSAHLNKASPWQDHGELRV